MQLLPGEGVLTLPDAIAADMRAFVEAVAADEGFKPADFSVRLKPNEALARLVAAYTLIRGSAMARRFAAHPGSRRSR